MRPLRPLALALLAAGVALVAASVATGEGRMYLLLIVPVFTSGGPLGLLGIGLLFGGILLGMLPGVGRGLPAPAAEPAAAPGTPTAPAPPGGFGGVVMVGPIPIVFGSNPRIAKWMLLLGAAMFALVLAAWAVLFLQ